jgi:hypothetical protein
VDHTRTPRDDFPPFGYLDNPHHTWKLNPSGVLRSRPPAGMGWHRPNHGSYGNNQFADRAHLYIGVEVAGRRLLAAGEFRAARVALRCDLHTKNRLRYVWTHPAGVVAGALFFLVDEHALGCQITLERAPGAAPAPLTARLWLAHELAHNPATSRLWEHGLYAVPPGADVDDSDAAPLGLLGVVPEGDAWVCGLTDADGTPLTPAAALRLDAAKLSGGRLSDVPRGREPGGLQETGLLLGYDVPLAPDTAAGSFTGCALLARGASADVARRHWHIGLAAFPATLTARAADDERFWARAPQISGDWPTHWRRGLATDLETLRMIVRPPVGLFAGRWDGMQIQAPRLVLAEAALDALALAWAAPALARELLLECVRSAPRPNIPCLREDGSYNMVADDGAICGTGPEWGWPFAVADALWRASGDRAWLAALYPGLAAYLDWWLAHRRDAGGGLVHACSWESGQDVSARFGIQRTGGSDVRHLRPVDLAAATAHAASILAGWAAALDRPPVEAARWHALAEQLGAAMGAMWHNGWFRDFDTARGAWSGVRDPMQLAPVMCDLATAEQIAALRPAFDALPKHGGVWPPLVWPPVAYTALEAAQAAGLLDRAANLAAALLDRAWRRLDARQIEPDGTLPGVTREFWPEGDTATSAGIEGYGWGALTIHLLIRHLVGLVVLAPDRFSLAPALPAPLARTPGARYAIGPLPLGPGALTLDYRIPAATSANTVTPDALDVALTLTGVSGAFTARNSATGAELARATADAAGALRLSWRGATLQQVAVGPDGAA